MRENIRFLVELQGIDSVILSKKDIITSMPLKLLAADNELKEAQSLYEKQKQKYAALEKKKKEKEKETEEINERINKLKARISEIKTNKEYQAHLKEIENIEKERYAIEDEILAAMEAMETEARALKAEEAEIKDQKTKAEAFKKEVEKEIADAEKELSQMQTKRADIAGKISPDAYDDYIAILEVAGGLAVVEAKDEICQGCNMNIPPQLFVEIKKNEEIIQCLQCRRILYWKEPSE